MPSSHQMYNQGNKVESLQKYLTNCIVVMAKSGFVRYLDYEESGPISAVEEALGKLFKNQAKFFCYKASAMLTDFRVLLMLYSWRSDVIKIKRNRSAFLSNSTGTSTGAHV